VDRHLALVALDMALTHRRPAAGLVHHSQGDCYDNAVAESNFQRRHSTIDYSSPAEFELIHFVKKAA